jgi:hypothetical protein
VKAYRPPQVTFKFPYRAGKSQAQGSYNAPGVGRPSRKMPSIKQFTAMKPGRPKPKAK